MLNATWPFGEVLLLTVEGMADWERGATRAVQNAVKQVVTSGTVSLGFEPIRQAKLG